MNARKHISRLLRVVSSPATMLHEATHAVFAVPFAEGAAVVLKPDVHVLIDWGDGVSKWQVFLAHFAPFILGSGVAVGSLAWMLAEPENIPDGRSEWLWLALLGLYWGVYTLGTLSERDRKMPMEDR